MDFLIDMSWLSTHHHFPFCERAIEALRLTGQLSLFLNLHVEQVSEIACKTKVTGGNWTTKALHQCKS